MMEPKQLFSICSHKETGEYHLFFSRRGADAKCYPVDNHALCGMMKISDKELCLITCASKELTIERAANIGNLVCNNCMKTAFSDNNIKAVKLA